jgi:hypothetical protein
MVVLVREEDYYDDERMVMIEDYIGHWLKEVE